MSRHSLTVACLLACALSCVAQPQGDKLTGPHNRFSFRCPQGWQHETFESISDDPAAGKFQFKISVFGEKCIPSDNFNLWWYPGKEDAVAKGGASLHRVALDREVTPDRLVTEVTTDLKATKGARIELLQLGKYVGALTTVDTEANTNLAVFIINGEVAYVGTLMGPKAEVAAQKDKFLQMLATLNASDVKPAKLSDLQGAKPAAAGTPGLIQAKSGKFTVQLPKGWKYLAYDKLEDRPNGKLIAGVEQILGAATVSDNLNFWWGPGTDDPATGVASLHRFDTSAPLDAKSLYAILKASGKLPQGLEARLAQLGDYVVLLVGGNIMPGMYVAAALIPQGNVTYLSTIIGPQDKITPQWDNYMKLVASIKSPELKPEKLEAQ